MTPILTTTGSSAYTVHIEDGEEVYPCRCGKTHRGPYAMYDYGHHNCRHELHPLLKILEEDGDPDYLMCAGCGAVLHAESLGPPQRPSKSSHAPPPEDV